MRLSRGEGGGGVGLIVAALGLTLIASSPDWDLYASSAKTHTSLHTRTLGLTYSID